MLWEYTQLLFAVAGLASILAFHKNIDKVGQVFFMLVGAICWFGGAISLLKVTFKWAGSTSVVSYTYIPNTESGFVYLFGAIGVMMLIIGLLRAVELTYQPAIKASGELLGDKKQYEF